MTQRCKWVPPGNELYERYHDEEWGVPVWDDRKQFEFLTLESAQAGLSWETILKRREGYRKAFRDFDPELVARFTDKDFERLIQDVGIIRNRQKIRAAINNAQRFLEVQREFGAFCSYIWRFVEGKPKVNGWTDVKQIPAVSPEAEALSRDLKKRGFAFVGPTIVYAHMQAVGLANDHTTDCFRYRQIHDMSS